MRLAPTSLTAEGDRVRLTARLESDRAGGFSVDLFVRVPSDLLGVVDRSANPFAALAALLATSVGEDLSIESTVSPRLLEGVNRSAAIYGGWVGRPGARVSAATTSPTATSAGRRGLLFTRGVDSSHTLIESEQAGRAPDLLLTVDGVDLGSLDAARGATRATAELAAGLGYDHLLLETGNRTAYDGVADWRLLHGAALTGAVLAVGPLLSRIEISAAVPNRPTATDGARADLVAGFGTEHTTFPVTGDGTTRPEKIRVVAADERLLPHLKVCWQPDAVGNCGRCVKCLITMTNLHAEGALDAAPFPDTLGVEAILSAPMTFQFYIEDTIAALPDSHADLRRAWRTRLAGFREEPALRLRPVPPVVGLDPLLDAEAAAAGIGCHVGTPSEAGVPLGWGVGALPFRVPRRLRHEVTTPPDRSARPMPWAYLGPDDATGAAAIEAMTEAWGHGWVAAMCHEPRDGRSSDLPASAATRLMTSAVVRAWSSDEPVFDGARALESARHGAIPLQFGPPDAVAVLRARMPEGTDALVVAAGGPVPDARRLDAADRALRVELTRGSFERDVVAWFGSAGTEST